MFKYVFCSELEDGNRVLRCVVRICVILYITIIIYCILYIILLYYYILYYTLLFFCSIPSLPFFSVPIFILLPHPVSLGNTHSYLPFPISPPFPVHPVLFSSHSFYTCRYLHILIYIILFILFFCSILLSSDLIPNLSHSKYTCRYLHILIYIPSPISQSE